MLPIFSHSAGSLGCYSHTPHTQGWPMQYKLLLYCIIHRHKDGCTSKCSIYGVFAQFWPTLLTPHTMLVAFTNHDWTNQCIVHHPQCSLIQAYKIGQSCNKYPIGTVYASPKPCIYNLNICCIRQPCKYVTPKHSLLAKVLCCPVHDKWARHIHFFHLPYSQSSHYERPAHSQPSEMAP